MAEASGFPRRSFMDRAVPYMSLPKVEAGWIIPTSIPFFYASNAEAGAVAESFGRFPTWTSAILAGSPALPGGFRAVALYHFAENTPICDLDDPAQLAALGLRPSDNREGDYTRTAIGRGEFTGRAPGLGCAGGRITIRAGPVSVLGISAGCRLKMCGCCVWPMLRLSKLPGRSPAALARSGF